MDLFDYRNEEHGTTHAPLAERMRPRTLAEVMGQEHLTGAGGLIAGAIASDRIFPMVMWGPPGCGKTTLASIIASETQCRFIKISAVLSGVKDVRAVIEEAKKERNLKGRKTVLFVDEIHRFNKAQQDAFLYHVESGLITLLGATTENPSFEVIPALLSRVRVVTLKPLTSETIFQVLKRAIEDPDRGLARLDVAVDDEALFHLVRMADGDVRTALNTLEILVDQKRMEAGKGCRVSLAEAEALLERKAVRYDKSGDEHFNLISAFHKSLRGSDPDGALYWMVRMLHAGEDPFYIARRMAAVATEDVGMADPAALSMVMHAVEAYKFLGAAEGERALAQAAVYLATAAKSNSVYTALAAVRAEVEKGGSLPVPKHICNAPTALMKEMGYKEGYRYAHDYPGGFAPQQYLPDELEGKSWYTPTDRGYESIVGPRLASWKEIIRRNKKK
ncbi:ATPase AAA [Desulfoluna limicola]|uniref:Replication-associated recombination protein A n=1 Tax=Desulfoluna limicola TaxID=2810562 RepID=A0ABM7PHL0_9BACT|nr:replication-associated recombination protein A [Desulfoluna limicola]BCS96837.1 ATPase AAA [Desulfoluna limicola]